jgi:putative membrane protein
MKWTTIIFAACMGAAVVVYLIFYIGLNAVLAAIASLGWSGFALICSMAVALFAVNALAWSVLIPDGSGKAWPIFFWGRTVRDSAGDILPFSQLGGIVISARAVALSGVAAANAYASTVVDVTTEMLAQILFIVMGAVLFVRHFGVGTIDSRLLVLMILGPVIAVVGAASFIVLQHRGPEFAEKLATRLLPGMTAHAGAFARHIGSIYASPARIAASIAIHFIGWLGTACFGWIAVRMIGGHIDYLSMVAIESVLSAIKSTAVIVPSTIGVQEATYAMLMPLFGVGPEVGVALSLIKRASSIAIGVPVLLFWQGLESRRALAVATREEPLSGN